MTHFFYQLFIYFRPFPSEKKSLDGGGYPDLSVSSLTLRPKTKKRIKNMINTEEMKQSKTMKPISSILIVRRFFFN